MAEFSSHHPLLAGILFFSAVLSLRLAVGLWLMARFAAVPWFKKVLWSCVLVLPVVGPLFYGAFFRVPRPHGMHPMPSVAGTGYDG